VNNYGSFQTHSPFSTLPEHIYSSKGAQVQIESTLGLLSQVQSTEDGKNNAWLYEMRDSTLEKICNGHIPLQYSKFLMENHLARSIVPPSHKGFPFFFSIFFGSAYNLLFLFLLS
jgi:hypothetical protein